MRSQGPLAHFCLGPHSVAREVLFGESAADRAANQTLASGRLMRATGWKNGQKFLQNAPQTESERAATSCCWRDIICCTTVCDQRDWAGLFAIERASEQASKRLLRCSCGSLSASETRSRKKEEPAGQDAGPAQHLVLGSRANSGTTASSHVCNSLQS